MSFESLNAFLAGGVFAFMVVFARIGTCFFLMPGISAIFVPARVRLFVSLGLTLAVTPLLAPSLPTTTSQPAMLLQIIGIEMLIGAFIGTLMRLLVAALEVAGTVIGFQVGLANALAFNPQLATQSTVIGTFLSLAGILLIFVTDLHHLMLRGVIDSYALFPAGAVPAMGDLSDVVARQFAGSFAVAIQMSAPFLVAGLILYIGIGLLARLMPQVQIFFIALPVQIGLGMIVLMLSFSAMMLVFLEAFRNGLLTLLG
jgi:flagellar biosynthetic protein FliR